MATNPTVEWKTVSPTPSYELSIPADVHEDDDDRVFSVWRPGSSVVLQASSYKRENGEQVNATDRLQQRMKSESLNRTEVIEFTIGDCSDVAGFRGIDAEGVVWFYIYCVWPDLTVLFTVTGKEDDLSGNGDWAFEAVKSARRLNAE